VAHPHRSGGPARTRTRRDRDEPHLPLDAENTADERAEAADQDVLAAERHAALRQAFADLASADQQLIALLLADPPVPYAEISARLGIPIGSIGPTRRRCLDKMRRHPAIAALAGACPDLPRSALAAAS
jgi:DNA-directed RNA polymerase specialized sigma24 family protein